MALLMFQNIISYSSLVYLKLQCDLQNIFENSNLQIYVTWLLAVLYVTWIRYCMHTCKCGRLNQEKLFLCTKCICQYSVSLLEKTRLYRRAQWDENNFSNFFYTPKLTFHPPSRTDLKFNHPSRTVINTERVCFHSFQRLKWEMLKATWKASLIRLPAETGGNSAENPHTRSRRHELSRQAL